MSTRPVKLSLLLAALIPSFAAAEHLQLPAMSVSGIDAEATPYALPEVSISNPDSGDLVKRLPGANINSNGPLTSIVQYRGLFSDRVNVLIDGVRINQAGPNSMDSPLSYIPGSRVGNVSIYRGIAPVSTGIETIGGTVIANSKDIDFANSDVFEFHGDLTTGYASNGNNRFAGVTAAAANNTHRFQASTSLDRGNNLEFGDGDIINTEHERDTFGLNYGYQHDGTEVKLTAEHHDTGKTGTPALPMDIIFARGENYKIELGNTLANGAKLKTRFNYQDADHLMSNYRFRNQADMYKRDALTNVKSKGIAVSYELNHWTVGVDADQAEHNADISNPTNAAFSIQNFNDIERDRYSAFAEWQGQLNSDWKLQSGLRLSRVTTDSGEVGYTGLMPMMAMNAATLRNAFNNSDRRQSDNLIDLTAVITYTVNEDLDLEFGLARKERAPSYQERYLWLPMESTSGLADGNNHLGNINLDPETAYQAELGLDWHTQTAGFSPRVFYHHINDYIQGTAITNNAAATAVSSMMGDTTPLQYNNVDAKLYGMDANWFVNLTHEWQLDGTVSYVRGERRDTNDDLYRLAPLTSRTMLNYVQPTWRIGAEAELVAQQNHVSAENEEKQTAGYALYHMAASYSATANLKLNAGINNIFDRSYQNHLAGYNRNNTNPDIAVKQRLYGLGRSFYASLNYTW